MKKRYILYRIARPIIKFFIKISFNPKIIGKEHIPLDGKCILAGNHTSNLDALLLMSTTKRTIRFLAKKELHKSIFGKLFESAGTIPVDRSKKDTLAKEKSISALTKGELICIFPEGTINRTSEVIMLFKYGTVSFAQKTNSKIVPFIIKGKYKFFRSRVKIKFLEPISLKTNNLEEENKKLMKIIKEELETNE